MLSRLIQRFARDRHGNLTSIFALTLIPVIGLVGAAVDYSRANKARTALQAALDATALAMSSKAATLSATQLQTDSLAYFNAVYDSSITPTINLTTTYTTTGGPQIVISGTGVVKTKLVNLLGYSQMNIGSSSTVAWGNTRLRVALALDNTGSMDASSKMTSLKSAAKNLIDQLKAAATNNGDVYVSIIPFARDVNVGSASYNANWIDWDDWEDDNGHDTSTTTCTTSKTGKSGKTKKKCSTTNTWVPDNHNTWNGCVTDRDQDYDAKNTTPTTTNGGTLFPADQYDDCPVALMPLSYDWTALKAKIDSMTPQGNTNTTIGLSWAWQSLMQNAPLNAPAEDANYQYNKVIIFLTDGDNTENRWTSSQNSIDARMTLACTNAKAAGIQIYTILVIDGNETLLKACATDANKYFKIATSSQLVTVFNQIGTNLSRLRVAK